MEETCKFCGQKKILIKAHVIPEAFFRKMRDGSSMKLISSKNCTFPKKAPIGVYEKNILCQDCELRFAPLDSYGSEILIQKFEQHFNLCSIEGVDLFQSFSVDSQKLLKFLISVIWRASVSAHEYYSSIRLGEHYEQLAKKIILDDNLLPVFDAMLEKQISDDILFENAPMTSPRRGRSPGGIGIYLLDMGAIVAHIKVDKRPFHPDLKNHFAISKGSPIYIVPTKFAESAKSRAIMKVFHNDKNKSLPKR